MSYKVLVILELYAWLQEILMIKENSRSDIEEKYKWDLSSIYKTEEEWKNSNIYYVDYVHLYQLDDGKSVIKADNPFK